MARIIVEKAEVTKVMRSGKGFWAQTQYRTRNGETITDTWVVWSNDTISVGDVIDVEGLFSMKKETFTNDEGNEVKYTALHINNPTITKAQTEQPKQQDEWANKETEAFLPLDEQVPF